MSTEADVLYLMGVKTPEKFAAANYMRGEIQAAARTQYPYSGIHVRRLKSYRSI